MATRVAGKLFKDFMRQRVVSTSIGTSRQCSSSATSAPKISHFSKKGSLLTGATTGLIIAGGAYVSTVEEATFCSWLFSATKLVNPFFALLDAEKAHTLAILAAARGWVPREKRPDPAILGLEVWGRKFSSRIDLAAGFDKNAQAVEGLLSMVLALWKLDHAIINHCGFNSEGIVAVAKRLGAQHDVISFAQLSQVINVSSPNTPGLRMLQGRKQLKDKKVQAARDEMQWGEEGPPPLHVAVALRLDGLVFSFPSEFFPNIHRPCSYVIRIFLLNGAF
ncbi:hypothetical protein PTKIN_Ptkin10aG0087600 [Pterospermum kingtungense]